MNDIIISLPIYLELRAKKKTTFSLNLNTYRNAHYQILNNAKILYTEIVAKLIQGMPRLARAELTYRLFFGSKRRIDIANVCCIVDKFFCDALVKEGKLPGDDREIIPDVRYVWGGIDTQNPHVEVTLSNIELLEEPDQDTPMQISFSHTEIREALVEYLEKQITLADGQRVELEFDFSDPTDIIAYIDVLREGQKAKGMPPRSEPEKTVTNTPRSGESETQTSARKTRGPNKPKTAAPVETPESSEVAAAVEAAAEVEPKIDAPFPGPFVNTAETKAVFVPGAEAPIQPQKVEPEIEAATETEAESPAEALKSGNSIFPKTGNSAPAPTAAASATPLGGKSLFSGLIRPTNAQTAH